MTNRYYSPEAEPDARVTLEGPEAHHLLHVMRAAPGDQIELFDGRGNAFPASIVGRSRSTVELETEAVLTSSSEPTRDVTVAVAMPKGDRQKWLIEKCTELGVDTIAPLITERSVATTKNTGGKLLRYAIEACKQCGRNQLPKITAPVDWDDWITHAQAGVRLVAHPTTETAASQAIAGSDPIAVCIGPEGGFTHEELEAAMRAGWIAVSLGSNVLRIETAAAAFAALAILGSATNNL